MISPRLSRAISEQNRFAVPLKGTVQWDDAGIMHARAQEDS